MIDQSNEIRRVSEKWGFGMAPPKAKTQRERISACELCLQILCSRSLWKSDERTLQYLSTVKGMFNRVVRQDQWDWFTVYAQLGYPSHRLSRAIANEIALLRSTIKDSDPAAFGRTRARLCCIPTRVCLSVFVGKDSVCTGHGGGWLYVLSTRELRDLLKIGITTRSLEQRVREINRATGVAIPFGVRRCWRVSNPLRAERTIHRRLQRYRLRVDREFFRASFKEATEIIDAAMYEESLEVRTLDVPGELSRTSRR